MIEVFVFKYRIIDYFPLALSFLFNYHVVLLLFFLFGLKAQIMGPFGLPFFEA